MSPNPTAVSELATFPRVSLGHTPTPLDHARTLGRSLGIELHIKRDDCTGLAFGGNKVRQLEFYLGEARAQAADTVLITGAVQSNFVRLTAAAARSLGMEVHIQLEERVDGVNDNYRRSGNVLLNHILGAKLHYFPVGEDESAADRALDELAKELREAGRQPYVIHLGVEHPPIGALGYVAAAQELLAQWRQAHGDEPFDAAVVASGSGLTHTGLLVGLRALGVEAPVHGICVRRPATLQLPRLRKRAAEVASLLGRPELVGDEDVRVSDEVLAPGYGKLNQRTLAAIRLASRSEGLMLDPVYTGKSMAGLVALAENGTLPQRARVVYLHTGGHPALFAYVDQLTEAFDEAAVATAL